MNLINLARLLSPPFLTILFGRLIDFLATLGVIQQKNLTLTGPFHSWEEALQSGTGYDDSLILEKTKNALLKVKSGEAVCERDSVLFDEIQYSWELLAGLMWQAGKNGGRLHVLDLGGSLGSTYFQNIRFLDSLPDLRWNVVEQEKHVEVGREYFSTKNLRFYHSIDECINEDTIDLIVLSGVLQYLESPYEILEKLMAIPAVIIIDRTPFYEGSSDKVFLQTVPPCIYSASYPCWIFSRKKFNSYITEKNRSILSRYDALDQIRNSIDAKWHGMILTPQ